MTCWYRSTTFEQCRAGSESERFIALPGVFKHHNKIGDTNMKELNANREARQWLNDEFGIVFDDNAVCELHGEPANTCSTCIEMSE